MTPRCEPPPEWLTNDDTPYHWVCHKHDDKPSIARFRARGTPPLTSLYVDDELASEANGWRYLAPCRPDDATERLRLEAENARLRAALRVAALRHMPALTHAQISAEIERIAKGNA